MAEVTVVIPTHNRRALLARTLHSVLAQRHVDLAVVVVDDGGSDGTAKALDDLNDTRVTVVRHDRPRGVSAARNSGIAKAVTPWLAFVDDDDLWAPAQAPVAARRVGGGRLGTVVLHRLSEHRQAVRVVVVGRASAGNRRGKRAAAGEYDPGRWFRGCGFAGAHACRGRL